MTAPVRTDAEQAKDIAAFKRAAATLNKLGKAGYYLYMEDDNLNLMTGPSHDENGRPQPHLTIAYGHIPGAGGGGW